MSVRRTYLRGMDGWWRRDPFFVRYMAREATALFVAAYALILLAGVLRLSQGPEAFDEWLHALASPVSVGFHLVLLVVFAYHTWSWFRIMPKTMPPVRIGGRRLSGGAITAAGLAAAAVVSAAFVGMIAWLAS